jgi:hypothetical protein
MLARAVLSSDARGNEPDAILLDEAIDAMYTS